MLIDFLKDKQLIDNTMTVWEPACGEGHMVNVFVENNIKCIGTDIQTGTDFLETNIVPCQWIITNPPFSASEQFIEQCLQFNKPFALLLKTQYWNAKKRLILFRKHQPLYILPLTWRPDFLFKTRGKGAPLMDVMWVVWGKESADNTYFYPVEKPTR